jgi:hypothetical protein
MVASRAVITYLLQLYILLQAILTLPGQVARHYPDPTVASSHRDLFVAAGFGFQCTWEHQRCTSVITDLPDLCIGKSMVYEEDSLNRGFFHIYVSLPRGNSPTGHVWLWGDFP